MSGHDLVRGLTDIPLSGKGKLVAHEVGIRFARRGGLDTIRSSSLNRAISTASIIQQHNYKTEYRDIIGVINTWGLGALEGMEKDGFIQSLIDDYIRLWPKRTPPSPSIQQRQFGIVGGEPFDHFRLRVLGWVKEAMKRWLMDPTKKEAWVTHHRVLQLVRGWVKLGCPDDFKVDIPEVMKRSGIDNPGQVERLWWDGKKWHMDHENMDSLTKLKPSIYPVRHSFTVWNVGSGGGVAS